MRHRPAAMRARHLLLLALLLSSGVLARAQDDETAGSGDADDSAAEEEPAVEEPPPPPPKAKAPSVISVAGAEAQVISPTGKKLSSSSADFGGKLLKATALDQGHSIEVTFTPKLDSTAFKPQQAMVMLVPAGHSHLAAYAVAKARKDGSHTATLSLGAVEKQLGTVGGKVAVTLLLGDPAAAKGVRWELGSVELPPDQGAKPSPAYRTARVQPMSNLLPNIEHTFRPAEKRPAAVVSLAFTGLALAPLAALVLWLLSTGALSLAQFPSGPGSLFALLFHGGIAALLFLYFLFWTRLNLAQTLPLAAGLGLGIAGVGYKALSAVADARLARERAAATPAKKTN